ncbi:MAG: DMT family transporter, partial [Acetobacteraceae bacterium]|nr:DMT family transporter [Acetobacteraceae bacterium]
PPPAGHAAAAQPAGPSATALAGGLGFLIVAAFAWGLNWPVLKFLMADWPPFTFRVLGAVGAVALLLLVAWRQGDALAPPGGQWGRLSVAGVLNVTSWGGMAPLALIWLDAAEAAIIAYTMPVWAMLMAWPVLGERPTAPRLVGLVCGLSGMGLLMAEPAMVAFAAEGAPWSQTKLPGLVAILVTALMFAAGAVFTKRCPIDMAPMPLAAWQIVIGMIPVAGMAWALEPRIALSDITPLGWGCIIYVGLIAQAVAYLAWFRALKRLPASTATIGSLLAPVIGVLGSGIILAEPLGWTHAAALMLVLAGMLLATRG